MYIYIAFAVLKIMWVNINVSGSGYVWWMLIIDEIFTRRLYKEKKSK